MLNVGSLQMNEELIWRNDRWPLMRGALVCVSLLPFHCEAKFVQLAVFDRLSFLCLVLRGSSVRFG